MHCTFSQRVEDSKAQFSLDEAKVISLKRDCSGLCNFLDQMSLFLKNVKQYGSLATLASHVEELERLLKEEKHYAHQVEFELKSSSSSAQDIKVEFKEKRYVQSKELESLREEQTTLNDQCWVSLSMF